MLRQRSELEVKNAGAKRSRVVNIAADAATIYLYDVIGGWEGIRAADVAAALATAGNRPVSLRINSPGGDVFEGRTIATLIAGYGAPVTAYIDGLAASAASWIALAAREVVIARGAFFMVHNSSALVVGDKGDMLQMASTLEQLDASFVSDYVAKTGAEREQVRAWMDAETWFDADAALAAKFADRIEESKQAANRWDVSAYRNAPPALLSEGTPAEGGEKPGANLARASAERRLRYLEQIAA